MVAWQHFSSAPAKATRKAKMAGANAGLMFSEGFGSLHKIWRPGYGGGWKEPRHERAETQEQEKD